MEVWKKTFAVQAEADVKGLFAQAFSGQKWKFL
jgi:hypothetical protein